MEIRINHKKPMATGLESLDVYRLSFELAMKIFEESKYFPKEEKYSLTDQIRRSSRAVCAHLAEAYRKRQYPAHFISKLSDADMENSETQVWLNFSKECNYFSNEKFTVLLTKSQAIDRMLDHMIHHPEKFTRNW